MTVGDRAVGDRAVEGGSSDGRAVGGAAGTVPGRALGGTGAPGQRTRAAAGGALMTVSTSASTPLAEVAAVEPAAPKWFQLYRLHSPAHTADLARRAGQAGYAALVLTVDLPAMGRRLRDVANDFALPAD